MPAGVGANSPIGRKPRAPGRRTIERRATPEVIMETLYLLIAAIIILIALDRGDHAVRARRGLDDRNSRPVKQ